jgi:CDP-diacylglycerol--glycerol-3-phosphate 3-phosphatidyltransferase
MVISQNPKLVCFSFPLFLIGAITDYFDGWFARRMKAVSVFGKFFDPLADKFLTGAAFLAFVVLSILPLWMVLIIIFRDVLTTTMRFMPFGQNKPIETSYSAKIKTFLQMAFIIIILVAIALINCPMWGIDKSALVSFIYSDFIYYSMLSIVILTLWTLADYSIQLKKASHG